MMALMSRTAEHLYWLGRHLERIEWSARIVREHTRLLVDLPVDVESDWSSLLTIAGMPFERHAGSRSRPGEDEVVNLLMTDPENPGSIARSIAAARENLRITRQIVPWSAWEALNALHVSVMARAGTCSSRSMRLDLCDAIIESCQVLTGIMIGTMSRDHAFALCEVGRNIERADMTSRVLDVRAGSLMVGSGDATAPSDRSPFEDVRWLGVLKTTGGLQMYHRRKASSVEAETVLDFLIHDVTFPNSIARCVLEIGSALESLPRRSEPSAACDSIATVLARRPATTSAAALHARIEGIIDGLDHLHDALAGSYFVSHSPAVAIAV